MSFITVVITGTKISMTTMVTTNINIENIDTEMDIIMDTAMGIGTDTAIEPE